LIGVYDLGLCRAVAEVLSRLGAEHVMVVHSADGLDEISIAATTHIAEARGDTIREFDLIPGDVGIEPAGLEGLNVGSAEESLDLIRAAMTGAKDDRARRARDLIALNAGAALHICGRADGIGDGVSAARQLMASGAAWDRLQALVSYSAGL
jgi:anthranilate phosphoribosyltransferase